MEVMGLRLKLMAWLQNRPHQLVFIGVVLVAILAILYGLRWLQPTTLVSGDFEPFATKEEYTAFYKQHPLMRQVAPKSGRFSYKPSVGPDKQAVYQIELFAPALHPGSAESAKKYVDGLHQSQQEALTWMKDREDLSKAYLIWEPDPDKVSSAGPTPPPIPQKNQPSPTPSNSHQHYSNKDQLMWPILQPCHKF